ncbi:hypothetical protein AB0O31_02510 [Kitasatospora cineracea]|uniref:hypothetical protein n=1 Tax=Kitasatospora cineracea TaxID=88074 RepID=UPI003417B5BA
MSTESADAAEPGTAAAATQAPAPPTPAPSPSTATAAGPAAGNPFAPPVFGAAGPDLVESGTEPARRRRRFGTGALFLTAVLAGPVIGAAVGYAIQSSRPPTPLPALTAPKLGYPAERVDAAALAAAGPPPLNIDGDLRRLLIDRPAGSTDRTDGDGDGWLSAADRAETFGDSEDMFVEMLGNGFRRAATVRWKSGDDTYRVMLVQYVPESVVKAITGMVPSGTSGMDVSKFPGNDESVLLVAKEPYTYARSTETYYYGEAIARKGTVLMTVQVYAKNPVDRAQLEDIAKRQWERLA